MVIMFLAEGFEETEAIAPADLLRRAGCKVYTVGIGGEQIRGAHGFVLIADYADTVPVDEEIEAVILPGGMPGTKNLEKSALVIDQVKQAYSEGAIVAAICAAPSILGHLGLLNGRKAVCYPGYESELKGAVVPNVKAVTDGNIITAKGPGACFEFAYELISSLKDKDTADKIIRSVVY